MLYDFHHKQNSKKPGSVHATYLISGTKRAVQINSIRSQGDGDDTVMRSSPPLPSSSIPQPDHDTAAATPIRSIMLVKEEHLDQARGLFEAMTSIHIYSLQANGLNDFQPLTECNRRVAAEYASEDPLKEWKTYGTIQNPNVRRKTRKTAPVVPATKAEPVKAKAVAAAAAKTSVAEIKEAAKPSTKNPGAHAQPEGSSKPAPSKKASSSIFKSFAKSAADPKKTDSQQSSTVATPAAEPEDVPMTGFSDDDLDDDQAESGIPEQEAKEPSGKSKKQREAELQAMMDQEDEPMEDVATPGADDERHDDGAIDKAESQPKEEPKETVTVENGRRRGRRRIMKKKTVKDEDGYLGESIVSIVVLLPVADPLQSQEKKQLGNRSLKMSLPTRSPRSKLRQLPRHRPARREQKLAKATSCLFSQRSNVAAPEADRSLIIHFHNAADVGALAGTQKNKLRHIS